jgi:hypothetical protein
MCRGIYTIGWLLWISPVHILQERLLSLAHQKYKSWLQVLVWLLISSKFFQQPSSSFSQTPLFLSILSGVTTLFKKLTPLGPWSGGIPPASRQSSWGDSQSATLCLERRIRKWTGDMCCPLCHTPQRKCSLVCMTLTLVSLITEAFSLPLCALRGRTRYQIHICWLNGV